MIFVRSVGEILDKFAPRCSSDAGAVETTPEHEQKEPSLAALAPRGSCCGTGGTTRPTHQRPPAERGLSLLLLSPSYLRCDPETGRRTQLGLTGQRPWSLRHGPSQPIEVL
jgi:hypothetical protein